MMQGFIKHKNSRVNKLASIREYFRDSFKRVLFARVRNEFLRIREVNAQLNVGLNRQKAFRQHITSQNAERLFK